MTQVEKIIIKHYGKGKRFKTRGWEECGQEIEEFIRSNEDKINMKGLSYYESCNKCDAMRRRIEGEYEMFFRVGSFFNWINGNESLKRLIN